MLKWPLDHRAPFPSFLYLLNPNLIQLQPKLLFSKMVVAQAPAGGKLNAAQHKTLRWAPWPEFSSCLLFPSVPPFSTLSFPFPAFGKFTFGASFLLHFLDVLSPFPATFPFKQLPSQLHSLLRLVSSFFASPLFSFLCLLASSQSYCREELQSQSPSSIPDVSNRYHTGTESSEQTLAVELEHDPEGSPLHEHMGCGRWRRG